MAQKRPNKMMRGRIAVLVVLFVAIGFAVVAAKLLYLQVIHTEFYQEKANENQTKDLILTPKRGTIYDRNMTELVTSATTLEISIDPDTIKKAGQNSVGTKTDADGNKRKATDEEIADAVLAYQKKITALLVKYLDVDEQETLAKVQKNVKYVRIQRQVEMSVAEALLAEATEQNLTGIYTNEDSKRYYKNGQFAAQVLGFTNTDGEGLYGIEKQYNEELQGVAGRVVKATIPGGAEDLPYDFEEYTAAQDGDGVVLTIDEGVQYYLEKHLEEALEDNDPNKGVCGIVMDINTGEILAMATKPDFDPNNPRTIPEEYTQLLEQLDGLEGDEYSEKYSEILLGLWRNKTINDTYEPGSTFKVFTVSSALEAGVVTTDDTFFCPGYKVVSDWGKINCWKDGGHGSETLAETLQNSCNVGMMDISEKLGIDLFRKYFEAYGLMEKTGIDLIGEANGIFFSDMGETDLATASFGQNFQVTPIQELCMVSAAANGGKLITPHVVKEIVDTEGNVKQSMNTEVKRQVISEQTSEIMDEFLEQVVSLGTGQNAYVAGYRIGGKTATSEKQPRKAGIRIASFIGIAPMDDPQYAVLVMIDEPQGSVKGGGAIAAPVVARIFEDILPALGVEPVFSEEEAGREEITVPTLTEKPVEEAEKQLEELGLEYTISGDGDTVTDQSPAAGISLQKSNTVVLYCGEAKDTDKVKVPNLKGLSIEEARAKLAKRGLYMKQNGVADWRTTVASTAIYQNPAPKSKVERGSVVTVAFGNAVTSEE
ncbi:MAG: penicillin-binding transpeptidase domain-containing protein [Butyricicoccus sp.]